MEQVDFPVVLPEIALALYAMIALMLAVYTKKDAVAGLVTWATVAVFLALAASQSLPFLAQLAVGVVVGGSCLLLLRVFGRQELQMILRMRAQS